MCKCYSFFGSRNSQNKEGSKSLFCSGLQWVASKHVVEVPVVNQMVSRWVWERSLYSHLFILLLFVRLIFHVLEKNMYRCVNNKSICMCNVQLH